MTLSTDFLSEQNHEHLPELGIQIEVHLILLQLEGKGIHPVLAKAWPADAAPRRNILELFSYLNQYVGKKTIIPYAIEYGDVSTGDYENVKTYLMRRR